MSESKWGLALGGGGARGFASIGVLEALEARALSPKSMAGTSMGAIIGALWASGRESKAIAELVQETGIWNLFRVSILRFPMGIFRPGKIGDVLARYVPSRIEELEIPMTIVTVDIDTGEKVYLQEGDLVQALMAGFAIPVAFEPVRIAGHRLVDGGLLEQVPVFPLLAQGCRPVLGISHGYVAKKKTNYSGLFGCGIRAIDILGKFNIEWARSQPHTHLIEPDVENQSVMAFGKLNHFIQAGREAMNNFLNTNPEVIGN